MDAIDTNVIVRYLTGDHPRQSAKARSLIETRPVHVATTVLLETEWVLRHARPHGSSSWLHRSKTMVRRSKHGADVTASGGVDPPEHGRR